MENTNKKNFWPYGLMIGMGLFIAFIGYLVYRVTMVDVHLVRDDYYEHELQYEQTIASMKRANVGEIFLRYNGPENQLRIVFSDEFLPEDMKNGSIHFYRPSDAGLDFQIPLHIEDGEQTINTSAMKEGLWRVKVGFEKNQLTHYKELAFNK